MKKSSRIYAGYGVLQTPKINIKRKEFSSMAIIPKQTFFVWSEIENLGDLERLRLVLEYMPDEDLM
ncbi:MAG TPA: hypothetical protein VK998_08285 [Schnuerera sp.]|nr:hypothetical protein [Schnuerera sp.]